MRRALEAPVSGSATEPVIEMRGLGLTYAAAHGEVNALTGIEFKIRPNEFVSVVGPSGCGKTSLLKLISGLIKPSEGTVTVGGGPPEAALKRQAFGFIFQSSVLLPWRTARQNVEIALELARRDMRAGERRAIALDLLGKVGLSGFTECRPHELSGGMQQRVSIARALSTSPSILLMDEPFGALDEIARELMQNELLRLWEVLKSTIVFITHSLSEAILLSDRVVIMSSRPGRVLKILEVDAPRPRTAEFRNGQKFHELLAEARASLESGFSYEQMLGGAA
jgi:NitT/TauT family transport system ATP-binding protein